MTAILVMSDIRRHETRRYRRFTILQTPEIGSQTTVEMYDYRADLGQDPYLNP